MNVSSVVWVVIEMGPVALDAGCRSETEAGSWWGSLGAVIWFWEGEELNLITPHEYKMIDSMPVFLVLSWGYFASLYPVEKLQVCFSPENQLVQLWCLSFHPQVQHSAFSWHKLEVSSKCMPWLKLKLKLKWAKFWTVRNCLPACNLSSVVPVPYFVLEYYLDSLLCLGCGTICLELPWYTFLTVLATLQRLDADVWHVTLWNGTVVHRNLGAFRFYRSLLYQCTENGEATCFWSTCTWSGWGSGVI